jgi:hypothetical protein
MSNDMLRDYNESAELKGKRTTNQLEFLLALAKVIDDEPPTSISIAPVDLGAEDAERLK